MAKVRISIDVDKKLKDELTKRLPWGTQNQVYRALFTSFLNMCKKHGTDKVVGALLTGNFDLYPGVENGGHRKPEEINNSDVAGRARSSDS